MKKAQKMFALAMVVIGLSFGVAGCEKPQEPTPTTPPAGEMKKEAPTPMTTPAMTPAATPVTTPAAPANGAKATTTTASK